MAQLIIPQAGGTATITVDSDPSTLAELTATATGGISVTQSGTSLTFPANTGQTTKSGTLSVYAKTASDAAYSGQADKTETYQLSQDGTLIAKTLIFRFLGDMNVICDPSGYPYPIWRHSEKVCVVPTIQGRYGMDIDNEIAATGEVYIPRDSGTESYYSPWKVRTPPYNEVSMTVYFQRTKSINNVRVTLTGVSGGTSSSSNTFGRDEDNNENVVQYSPGERYLNFATSDVVYYDFDANDWVLKNLQTQP